MIKSLTSVADADIIYTRCAVLYILCYHYIVIIIYNIYKCICTRERFAGSPLYQPSSIVEWISGTDIRRIVFMKPSSRSGTWADGSGIARARAFVEETCAIELNSFFRLADLYPRYIYDEHTHTHTLIYIHRRCCRAYPQECIIIIIYIYFYCNQHVASPRPSFSYDLKTGWFMAVDERRH